MSACTQVVKECKSLRLVSVKKTYNFICLCFVVCSFADQLAACVRQVKCYIDSDLSAVVGTTYYDIRQFVEAIDMSKYFDCSFAVSQVNDVVSCDHYEANLADMKVCENDQKLSGLLFNLSVPLISANCLLTLKCMFIVKLKQH